MEGALMKKRKEIPLRRQGGRKNLFMAGKGFYIKNYNLEN